MLAQLYLYGFLAICLALIVWGLVRLERIYQYPFFMASIFLTFVYPQAVALVNNPAFVSETALERVLLMSCLCVAMCWVGYRRKPNEKLMEKLAISVDDNKLLHAAIILTAIGFVSKSLVDFSSKDLEIGEVLSGPGTIYWFFSQTMYTGFTIFIIRLLKKPSIINFCGTLIASIPILQIVLGGRRQPTITFLIIIGFSIWQCRGLLPPRLLIVIAIFLGFYLIPLLGQLRFNFWTLVFEQDWQSLFYEAQKNFDQLQKGDILELRNAALSMDAVEFYGEYQWGTGLWDALVFQYVPGQLLGYDFKNSLMFNLGSGQRLFELYDYQWNPGSTITGMGDSYQQFGYFGCLLFALIGNFFKTLWIASVEQKSMIATLLMVGCISPAMVAVSHGIGRFLQELVFQVIVVSLVAYYAGSKSPSHIDKTIKRDI